MSTSPSSSLSSPADALSFTQRFAMFAVCCLAVSVSLGVALVSLSKLLMLMAVALKLVQRFGAPVTQVGATASHRVPIPLTLWCVLLALSWMALTTLWTEAPGELIVPSLMRHARFWVLVAVWYLIDTPRQAWTVIKCLLAGHVFLVVTSWLMWSGVKVPWAVGMAADDLSQGIPFASRLEQPILYTLAMTQVWYWREHLSARARSWVLWGVLGLTFLNFALVMTGRSGYVSLLLAMSLMLLLGLPKRWRVGALVVPLLAAVVLYNVSPRIHEGANLVYSDVVRYQQGDISTNQGQRLEFWHRSLQAIQDAPWLGHGVGSWNKTYLEHGGAYPTVSNPHQQFLLWAVEAGLVGLLALLAIFWALWRDARDLPRPASHALWVVTGVSLGISMMNCPFFGAGLGEYFGLLMGVLLAQRTSTSSAPQPSGQ